MYFSPLRLATLALAGTLLFLSGVACSGSTPAETNDLKLEASALVGDAQQGELLFAQPILGDPPAPGCINCHGTTAEVELVGPSLPDLSDLSTNYLLTSIIDPDAAYPENGRRGGMYSSYEEALSAQEIADLIAYLQVAHGGVE